MSSARPNESDTGANRHRGTAQGEAARKYAGFTYRKPVVQRVDIWQLDPERLHPAHEYPRSVNPPCASNLRSDEFADFSVITRGPGSDGMSSVQVWMEPNACTAEKAPLMVCEFSVQHALTLRPEIVEEAARRAFA